MRATSPFVYAPEGSAVPGYSHLISIQTGTTGGPSSRLTSSIASGSIASRSLSYDEKPVRPSWRASCPSAAGWCGTRCVHNKRLPADTLQFTGTMASGSKLGSKSSVGLRRVTSYARRLQPEEWRGQLTSDRIRSWAPVMTPFTDGAARTAIAWPVRGGRSTVTGSANGTTTRRGFAPTSTICCRMKEHEDEHQLEVGEVLAK